MFKKITSTIIDVCFAFFLNTNYRELFMKSLLEKEFMR